jgi:hypothetical protein
MQDNMTSCTLLGEFSRELHSADYSWGISVNSPRAYFINSGAIPRRQFLKSAPCGNLKSTPVAPSPAPAAYCMCKLRWNQVVSGPLASWQRWSLAARGLHALYHGSKYPKYSSRLRSQPSSTLRWQLYLGSEIHGLGTQVDSGRTSKPAPAATVSWV